MPDIVSAMQWRYATKMYDTSRTIPASQLETLLDATRLSPSSFGLPTWKIIVVTDPSKRSQLKEAGWNQGQFTDASHLVVFATVRSIDTALIDQYMELIAATRGIAVSNLEGFRSMLAGSIGGRTPEQLATWAAKQAYIGLGTLMTAAALMQIDATPMEGFDPEAFDRILGLPEIGLQSVVACALGYRDPSDSYASLPKVRLPMDKCIINM